LAKVANREMAIILHLIALRSDCCRQLLVRSSAYGDVELSFEIIVFEFDEKC